MLSYGVALWRVERRPRTDSVPVDRAGEATPQQSKTDPLAPLQSHLCEQGEGEHVNESPHTFYQRPSYITRTILTATYTYVHYDCNYSQQYDVLRNTRRKKITLLHTMAHLGGTPLG